MWGFVALGILFADDPDIRDTAPLAPAAGWVTCGLALALLLADLLVAELPLAAVALVMGAATLFFSGRWETTALGVLATVAVALTAPSHVHPALWIAVALADLMVLWGGWIARGAPRCDTRTS